MNSLQLSCLVIFDGLLLHKMLVCLQCLAAIVTDVVCVAKVTLPVTVEIGAVMFGLV